MTPATLVRRSSAPPLPDFEEVFTTHGRFVWRALRYLGVGESDLDDACQEVFLVVHRRLADFQGRSSLRSWVYGIALRVASDYRKSAFVRRRSSAEVTPEAAPASALGQAEARQLLQRALDTLDEDKRAVLVLHELEGFSIPEVAELLGCPVPTAYTRLHAALERVERELRRSQLTRVP
jgi:RNA polymerase sigma-70 factor (ECF subfamily)